MSRFSVGATAWAATACAHVIGLLTGVSGLSHLPDARAAFCQGLKENGFVEGKNIHIEFRETNVTTTAYGCLPLARVDGWSVAKVFFGSGS